MKFTSQRLRTALCATVLALAGTTAFAQADKPLKIVIGTPAGASLDTLGRLLADKMRVTLNRPVIIENRAGASGRIAAEAVKAAPPDGSTIWMTASANVVAQPLSYTTLKYDPFKDFMPVSQLASFQMALAVPANTVGTVDEYVAQAKKNPATAMFGSPSAGSLLHFLGVMLGQEAKVTLTHVPYPGSAPLVSALVGGQVPSAFLVIADGTQYHRSGRIKVLAVSGAKRSQYLPEVPTFKELGYNVEGVAWFAAFAPAGTPQALVDTISKSMADAVAQQDVQEKLRGMGLDPIGGTSRELAEAHRAEYQKLGPVIKASGFKGDE